MSLSRGLSSFVLLAALALAGCSANGVREELPADAPVAAATAPISPDELDPWQPFNRKMHAVNSVLDKAILRPVARGYAKVTPKPIRVGVSNFFDNLQQPVTALNLVLQGRPKSSLQSLGRFGLNLTVGLLGVLDPATDAGIPRHDRDFGQTLALWGWDSSQYLVLPVFGPGTVRDTVGKGLSTRVSPVSWLADQEGAEFSILYGINARASVLSVDAFLEGAEDEYLLVRDAYLQRRRCQIMDCSEDVPEYLLPDYEFEVPDLESMRR
jgi:phospholipid-binding lipoprotein MlaA